MPQIFDKNQEYRLIDTRNKDYYILMNIFVGNLYVNVYGRSLKYTEVKFCVCLLMCIAITIFIFYLEKCFTYTGSRSTYVKTVYRPLQVFIVWLTISLSVPNDPP